ncbi:MAG: glutamine-hydrolyzing GMP synthase [Planctomycetota bacterium]
MIETRKTNIVTIIDFGSQYTQLIARRIREIGVYSEIVPYYTNLNGILEKSVCLIFSGSPKSVYDKDAPALNIPLTSVGKPILGICYGAQLIAYQLKGIVEKSKIREYGPTTIQIITDNLLFKNIPSSFKVWMSHSDHIKKIPKGFEILARSSNNLVAGFANERAKIWCVQFHPEVYHTEYGKKILENFVYSCSGAYKNWDIKEEYKNVINQLKETIAGNRVLCAVSGGIDSLVTTVLISRVSNNIYPLFVDTGLLREKEFEKVKYCCNSLRIPIYKYDASTMFLKELKNVIDPEKKRKIIGKLFIKVFEGFAKKNGSIKYLAQGTLYPDIIESVSAYGAPSAKIKSHHNVGGLPKKINFKIVEPLKWFFKDEVRVIAKELGIPDEFIRSQPFPGPGFAIRIVGEVTQEKINILRKAEIIVREEIEKNGLHSCLWQYFPILLSTRSVGVMGDQRSYQYPIVLRLVKSVDGMTADWFYLDDKLLRKISNRIVNEVSGVNRVLVDITSKPPATIEWE